MDKGRSPVTIVASAGTPGKVGTPGKQASTSRKPPGVMPAKAGIQ